MTPQEGLVLMGNVYVDQDHNLNKILNADLTEIEPLYLHPDVLVAPDVLGENGIVVTDNQDGTITIGGGGGAAGYRETFTLVDPAAQLPLQVNHLLGVASGVVDVTVAKIGPPTRLVEAEITIISDNLLEVDLPGAQPGDYEIVILTEGPGGVTSPPVAQPKVWDPVVTYQPGVQVLWPASRPTKVWDAIRVTLDDEPGVAEPDVPILGFPGSATVNVAEGLSAPVVFAFPNGFDAQVRTSGADNVSEGTFVSVTDLMTDLPIFTFGVDSISVKLEIRTVSFGTALQPFYLPRTNFDLAARPCLRVVVTPTEALFYDAVDGKVWELRGTTPFPEALYLSGVTKVRIAHDTFDELRSYSGGLGSVKIFDPAGVPLSSWDPATQGADGVGISPETGEEYTKVGAGVFTPGVVQDPAAWQVGVAGQGLKFLRTAGGQMTGDIRFVEPNEGIVFADGSKIVGGATAGIAVTGNVAMGSNNVIQFPNEAAPTPKINLYANTFGLGVESGTTTLYSSARVRFRIGTPTDTAVGGITSPDVASVDATGFVSNGVWVPNLKVISNVALVVGHYYEVATVNYHRTVRFRIGVNGGGKPTRSQSLDGMAALPANDAEGASIYSGIMTIYGHTKGTMANSKLFDQLAVGPEKMWIRCSQASTVQVGIEAYDTASGANKTLSFADAGTAVGSYDEVAL